MGQSKTEEFIRITTIAHSKIPVSEESPVFSFFVARRNLARKLRHNEHSEEQRQHVLLVFEDINEKIKEYLLL